MKKLSYVPVFGCAILPLAVLGALVGPQASQAETGVPVAPLVSVSSSGLLGGLLSTGTGVDGLLASLLGSSGIGSPGTSNPATPPVMSPPVSSPSTPVTSAPTPGAPVASSPSTSVAQAPSSRGVATAQISRNTSRQTSTVGAISSVAQPAETIVGTSGSSTESLPVIESPSAGGAQTDGTKAAGSPHKAAAAEGFTLASLWGPGEGIDSRSGILTLSTMGLLAVGMVARFRYLQLRAARLTRANRTTPTD